MTCAGRTVRRNRSRRIFRGRRRLPWGAALHFIGQREFRELLFQNGLPWVMVFDGENGNAEDGTIVVAGDLREAFNPDELLFRNVKGLAQ